MKNITENKSSVIDAENKIAEMTKRIKILNESITKKKEELQINYNNWRQARAKNALAELSDQEVEQKKGLYFTLKEEVENLISELDPLSWALNELKERHEAALNNSILKQRETLIKRLKEIRELHKSELSSA